MSFTMTNKTLTTSTIALVAVVMGMSTIAPAIADHPDPDPFDACRPTFGTTTPDPIYDPNSETCVLPEDCPNGVFYDHCALDTNINDNEKWVICHQPSKANVTIEVSENAVTKHIAHGDFIGECAETYR